MSGFTERLAGKVRRKGSRMLSRVTDPLRLFAARYLAHDDVLVRVHHAPGRYARRADDFTANVCGTLAPSVRGARFRLNGGAWREIRHAIPRVPLPMFTLELAAGELTPGENRVEIEARTYRGRTGTATARFTYDPAPIGLPVLAGWTGGELDVQDGQWEQIRSGDGRVVRPVPGTEAYDRILVVTGAFSGGRVVETELRFLHEKIPNRPFGFGILPLWGGRPDSAGGSPRGGWNFSLVWYYSKYEAVGMEFSYKDADLAPDWTAAYRNLDLERDGRYRIAVRCWTERDASGGHRRWVQEMKWWRAGEDEPSEWLRLADTPGAPIADAEYAVALIAHQSQVEFGPVSVRAFDGPEAIGEVRGDER